MPTPHIQFRPGKPDQKGQVLRAIQQLDRKIDKIMATLQERFDAVNSALTEASAEILAEIAKLKEGGNLTPEQEASLEAIETKATAMASISPPV